jgi:hypothetical protein
VFAALFYGITGSMNMSMALATSFMTLMTVATLVWMLRPFTDILSLLSAIVLLFASMLVLNAANTIGQLFFVMCSYYACYLITMFVVWGTYLRIVKRKNTYPLMMWIMVSISVLLSFATGMQSLRQLSVMALPLCFVEAVRLIYEKVKNTRQYNLKATLFSGKIKNTRQYNLKATLFSGGVTAANMIGFFFMTRLAIPSVTIYGGVQFASPGDFPESIMTAVRGLGSISGLRSIPSYTPHWFTAMHSIVLVTLVVVVVAAALLLWRWEKAKTPVVVYVYLCLLSIMSVIAATVVFDVELRGTYLFVWFPLVMFSFVVCMDMVKKQYKNILVITLCLFTVITLVFNYQSPLREALAAPTDDEMKAAAWMEENGYTILYGPWVGGHAIAARSDGAILLGAWHFGLFQALPYINTMDIYSKEDNAKALYLISDSSRAKALEVAGEKNATMVAVAAFGPHTLYSSDLQLMTKPDLEHKEG